MSSLGARLEQRLTSLLEHAKRRSASAEIPGSLASIHSIAVAIEQRASALVERMIEPELRRAVLDRAELAARWVLGDADVEAVAASDAALLRLLISTEQWIDPPSHAPPNYWPPEVAPAEVASALERSARTMWLAISTSNQSLCPIPNLGVLLKLLPLLPPRARSSSARS